MDQASSPEYDRELLPEDRDRVFRERYARALAEMRYGMGPLSVEPVFSPAASGAKVSANVAGVEPYVVVDPSTGRPTIVEQGVTYGSGTPESGYQLRYSKNERTGQPVYSGAYRRKLDRDSELTAQGSYVPMPGRDAYQAMLQYRKRFAEGGEARADADDQIKKLYRDTLAREADTGGLEYWKKEFGPEVDVSERLRFIEGAQPEVQQRLAAGDTTLPGYMKVAPDVRRALQSTDVTTDEYKKLANYFGNQWIAGEAEDPASLTRRDYIERPRSGYDLATFLASRSQQHGAQADTKQRLLDLVAPYTNYASQTPAEVVYTGGEGNEFGYRVTNPITGQQEIAYRSGPLGPTGENIYRTSYGVHHSSIGDPDRTRYAVGLDYTVDPATGQATLTAPYLEGYQERRRNNAFPIAALATMGGMAMFPGFSPQSIGSRGLLSLGAQGVSRMSDGGEVTKFVKRQAGSPEEGETATESHYDMANNRLRGLNEELQDRIEMYRQGQITAKDLQEFFPGYSTFDLDRMFGTTDTDLPRHPNMAQPRLTPKFLADALNLEDILRKETETQLREGRKHPFLLRKDMPPGWETNMAQGGEVTKFVKRQAGSPENGEVAEQMTVGTIPRTMAQASEEPGIVTAKEITQPATRSAQAMKAYLEASIPDLKVVEDPMLERKGRRGQVNMDVPNVILISPKEKDMGREAVLLHEAEHSRVGKAVQGMPEKEQFDNDIRFDRLYGDKGSTRSRMVRNFVDNKDKIEKFFGVNIPDVYFEKMMYKNQSRFGSAGALFEEQIATLSALEQLTNKSITKGMPELFPDDKAAAIYDAITGLRQTRLDAKDLPPFTPQYKSGMDWIKEKLQSLKK